MTEQQQQQPQHGLQTIKCAGCGDRAYLIERLPIHRLASLTRSSTAETAATSDGIRSRRPSENRLQIKSRKGSAGTCCQNAR